LRPFAFLACLGCGRFVPKDATLAREPVLVGYCRDEGRVAPVAWVSLERAAQMRCPDREATPSPEPACTLYEASTESATRPYPRSCVYFGSEACPLPAHMA
jgi:hypothetical protein